jgi:HEAT repeats
MKKIGLLTGISLLLIAVIGCGLTTSEPEKTVKKVEQSFFELADIMQGVKDSASAKAAMGNLDAKYSELIDLVNKLPNVMPQHTDSKSSNQSEVDIIRTKIQKADKRLNSEVERLKTVPGLPVEFWKIVNVRTVDLKLAKIDANVFPIPDSAKGYLLNWKKMLVKNGYEGVIFLEITNLPPGLAQRAFDKLQQAAPGSAILDLTRGYEFISEDFAFAGSNSMYRHYMLLGPARDFKKIAAVDIGSILSQDEGQRYVYIDVDRRKLGARANTEEEEMQLDREDIARKIEQGSKQMQEHRDKMYAQMDAERAKSMQDMQARRNELVHNRGFNNIKSISADDYDQLADALTSDNVFQQDKAIEALLHADPSKVSSEETRKKIAKAFKNLAEEGHMDQQQKAVRGLVVWGGKFSVPILLKLLNDSNPILQRDVIKALADLQDPRAAAPIAALLDNFHLKDAARRALEDMGGSAEDGLIEAARPDNPDTYLTIITLLGEVGADKSLKILRATQNSRNSQVRVAGKTAIQQITDRKKAAKASNPN